MQYGWVRQIWLFNYSLDHEKFRHPISLTLESIIKQKRAKYNALCDFFGHKWSSIIKEYNSGLIFLKLRI